jgi:hypothetical protein
MQQQPEGGNLSKVKHSVMILYVARREAVELVKY